MINGDLVLIHGFWSSPATWDRLVRLFVTDPALAGLRVDPFGYPSPKVPKLPFWPTRIPDFDDIAETLASTLEVDHPDRDLAIVTHSQGGLILQRFLAWMIQRRRGEELARIRLIVMLSCPNNGTDYLRSIRADLGISRNPQGKSLTALDADVMQSQSVVLESVVNARTVSAHECRIPIKVYAGSEDNVVRPVSAKSVFPDAGTLPGGHSSILDPDAPGNRTFPMLKKHIIAALAGTSTGAATAPAPPATSPRPADDSDRPIQISNSRGFQIGTNNTQSNYEFREPS